MNPEITNLEGGKKLAKMSIATNETYKNQKGEKRMNKTNYKLNIYITLLIFVLPWSVYRKKDFNDIKVSIKIKAFKINSFLKYNYIDTL